MPRGGILIFTNGYKNAACVKVFWWKCPKRTKSGFVKLGEPYFFMFSVYLSLSSFLFVHVSIPFIFLGTLP